MTPDELKKMPRVWLLREHRRRVTAFHNATDPTSQTRALLDCEPSMRELLRRHKLYGDFCIDRENRL